MRTTEKPDLSQIPALRNLWKEAFGDSDAYLDAFFRIAFSPDRCRCITEDGQVASALYWFDCQCDGKSIAYLYAVATAQSHRHKGYAAALLEDTHRHLNALGYAGALLVPATPSLFSLYEKQGYHTCCDIAEFHAQAGDMPLSLTKIPPEEYMQLRNAMLPRQAVLQNGAAIVFLSTEADFYKGEDVLLCAVKSGSTLLVKEFLGSPSAAPAVLSALHMPEGKFRTPGHGRPFAMFRSLSDVQSISPSYFAFALD